MGIAFCVICLAGSTWAWFTGTISSSENTLKSAYFSGTVEITAGAETVDVRFEDGYYVATLTGDKTYNITLTAEGDAKGYARITLGAANYYTVPLNDGDTLNLTTSPEDTYTIKICFVWGSYSGDAHIDNGDIITPGDTPYPRPGPSEDPESKPTPGPGNDLEETYMYVDVSESKLNVRNIPSTTGSEIITTLDKGVVVTVLGTPEEAPDWRKIQTEDGTTGYAMATFLTQPPITVRAIVNVISRLNIRKLPTITADLITTLSPNDEVTILQYEIIGGWVKIRTADGKVGYCMQQYLKSSN